MIKIKYQKKAMMDRAECPSMGNEGLPQRTGGWCESVQTFS
jgi:hypothetical protein